LLFLAESQTFDRKGRRRR